MADEPIETSPPAPTFTQADVDRVIAERLKRAETAHTKQLKALRDALGAEEDADLAETIAALREQAAEGARSNGKKDKDADAITAAEKRWQDRIAKIEADNAARTAETNSRVHDTLIGQEVRALLSGVAGRITDDAPLLLDRILRDHLAVDAETYRVVPVGPDGEPARDEKLNVLATKDVLEGLLKQHPSLVRASVTGGAGAAPGGRSVPDSIASAQSAVRANPNAQTAVALTSAVLNQNRGART